METAVEEDLTIACHILVTGGANVDERYGLITSIGPNLDGRSLVHRLWFFNEDFIFYMANIESLIAGSEKLTDIFGYWPSFHDAEVLDLHFTREKGLYDFPILTLRIHVWELTKNVDSKGYLILLHHTLTTLEFRDVSDFQMQGFNHQNAMMELALANQERNEGPSPYFSVELVPAFGMDASFNCLGIEVIDAVSCAEDGKPILDGHSPQNPSC